MNNDILLESGTGEVEILEFVVNEKIYAINVMKVREVVDIDNLTEIPQSHPAIDGVVLCRNEILTLIDLNYVLNGKKRKQEKFKTIVCEFNKIKVAFKIDNITAIHRIRWDQILKPDDISINSLVIGNIILNEKVILLLDFEKIVTDISPDTGINENKILPVDYKKRDNVKIILADDSVLIRKLLNDTLKKAGFKNLKFFNDGKQTLDYLYKLEEEKKENFMEDVQILITDIEMPQLDGHTLTRKIKEHPILNKLPIIIFSSLITDDLIHKGKSVGADVQLSKPDVVRLVEIIDNIISEMKK